MFKSLKILIDQFFYGNKLENSIKTILKKLDFHPMVTKRILFQFCQYKNKINIENNTLKYNNYIIRVILWLSIYNEIVPFVPYKHINTTNFIIFGLSGSGKTNVIKNLILLNNFDQVSIISDNKENFNLLKQYLNTKIEYSYLYNILVNNYIVECSDIKFLLNYAYDMPGAKIYICIESQITSSTLYNLYQQINKHNLNIDGIIFTKMDFVPNIGSIVSSLLLFQKPVLFYTCQELSSNYKNNFKIYNIFNIIANHIFSFSEEQDSNINSVVKNLNIRNMQIYKSYLIILAQTPIKYLKKIYLNIYFQDDKFDIQSIMNNRFTNRLFYLQIKKQISVINSLNKKELKNPKSINRARKKLIAYGAGVSIADINITISSFINYEKSFLKSNHFL
ncbi:Signal recognition particle 54 kDa protein [bacterium AB1]|nr:Signal recognition particle 54 kDa protein [bacterium AB1]